MERTVVEGAGAESALPCEHSAALRSIGVDPAAAPTLVDRYIEPYPWQPTRVDHAWIRGTGPQVYAIVQDLFFPTIQPGNLEVAARAWCIPVDAVRAAVIYYLQHRDAFDLKIRWNKAPG